METIANSRAALQCSVEHAVTDEYPSCASHPNLSSLFLPLLSCLLVPSANPFLILLPSLDSLLALSSLFSRASCSLFISLYPFLIFRPAPLPHASPLNLPCVFHSCLFLASCHRPLLLYPPFYWFPSPPFSYFPLIFSIWQCSACCSIVSTGACMLEMELAMAAWKYWVSSSPASLPDWQTVKH